MCGIAALILDAAYALRTERFTVASPYSLPAMRWLFAIGFCGSLTAYIGYPARVASRVIVVVLCLAYALAIAVTWFM